MVLWRTTFGGERFREGGLRHSPTLDAWREYDGNTTHLPDAKARVVRGWGSPPAVDLRGGETDGWRRWRGVGGWL